MFALYGLLAMKSVFLDDFFTLAGGAIGPVRVPALGAGDAALLWGGKALFFAAFVGAPAAASGRSAAGLAALWLTSEAAAGWLLALLFQARRPCPALCCAMPYPKLFQALAAGCCPGRAWQSCCVMCVRVVRQPQQRGAYSQADLAALR